MCGKKWDFLHTVNIILSPKDGIQMIRISLIWINNNHPYIYQPGPYLMFHRGVTIPSPFSKSASKKIKLTCSSSVKIFPRLHITIFNKAWIRDTSASRNSQNDYENLKHVTNSNAQVAFSSTSGMRYEKHLWKLNSLLKCRLNSTPLIFTFRFSMKKSGKQASLAVCPSRH